ncbi:hypothetical protein SAMN05421823_113112 [Catalinimonas alkaloidigena]|uniref:Uncharacterized protein n=1 Tax=Catalinimonas alkaloidigena TaxID=1075417 RepID=A0A1G9T7D5_9BACT|nr:hypothetical protein [Catalinimonas alkaloidigena]SDM43643.1 hypothetical protein SAMN05421823_113112 [Catalinimonas alkaloidigena]
MKRIAILLVGLGMISSVAMAQEKRTELKGPKAKNYRYDKNYTGGTEVYSTGETRAELKGPAAKNYSPAQDEARTARYGTVVTTGSERTQLKGPRAKNYKPWRKKD